MNVEEITEVLQNRPIRSPQIRNNLHQGSMKPSSYIPP